MKIYVGRWDLLPKEWEGINGLYDKAEEEVKAEVAREAALDREDSHIAAYEGEEFEETFNHTLTEHISSERYWIKIFKEEE